MKKYLIAYLSTLLVFLLCDGIWLGVLMGPQYRAWLASLMLATPLVGPALLFYVLYPMGIVVFAVLPALQRERLGRAAAGGAFLGLMAYATYDLTNWSTLQGWPAQLALIDWFWGVVASGLAATGGYLITTKLLTTKLQAHRL